ncbi:MAG: anti-sigma factor [bacterium]|nr:anti-sigma factor [bacterium]
MDDMHARRSDAELEAMLRDLDPEDLELIEPPAEVWEGIESAVRTADDTGGTVVPLEAPRRALRRIVLGVAAALILVAVALAVTLTRDDPVIVVAAASLAYDAETFDVLGAQAQARAELITDDGRASIQFVDAALPSPEAGADLEVWLIRPDDEGGVADLVSLGLVDPADPGTLDVPAGYDPDVFFVVDISVEPRDGDARHSGRSILRGPLEDI